MPLVMAYSPDTRQFYFWSGPLDAPLRSLREDHEQKEGERDQTTYPERFCQ